MITDRLPTLFAGLFVILAGFAIAYASPPAPPAGECPWTQASCWPNGQVPTATTDATIPPARTILLDSAGARVRRLTVEGQLVLSGGSLEASGNIIVRGSGRLTGTSGTITLMVPAEDQFVGGGMEPVDTDVGLWVVDTGQLDLTGTAKLPWTRVTTSLAAGTSTLTLPEDPIGWAVGDEISIVPTGPPTEANPPHYDRFELRTIRSISGRTIAFSAPLAWDHPSVTIDGKIYGAEVLNLSRSISIQGRPGLRTHVFMRSTVPQFLRHVLVRHVGPRRSATEHVLGRWGLHWHHAGNGARGSLAEGVVVRDVGSWGFVPHASHGIIARRVIVYDSIEDGYTWDPILTDLRRRVMDPHNIANDILIENSVAARVRAPAGGQFVNIAGFKLMAGTGNAIVGGVVVGSNRAGAHWSDNMTGVWEFRDVVIHNNLRGIFNWKNDNRDHVLGPNLIVYHNLDGIRHGAYANGWQFRNMRFHGNPIHLVASGLRAPRQVWEDIVVDLVGLGDYALISDGHILLPGTNPVTLRNIHFRGYRRAGVYVEAPRVPTTRFRNLDIMDCTFSGNEFWVDANAAPGVEIRVQRCTGPRLRAGDALLLRPIGQPGDFTVPEWNASVTRIAPF